MIWKSNKKNILNKKESRFWNNPNIVDYFYEKEADFRIVKRLKEIKFRKCLNALDLGCGGGRHTEMLLSLGFYTYSCDPAEEMLKITKKRVDKLSKKGEKVFFLKKGSILKIPFKNNFFDVVVATGVLHQSKSTLQYQKAIKELARVTKKGGLVTLNIFTNKFIDKNLKQVKNRKFVYITQDGLWITLLSKKIFYQYMLNENLRLEKELSEERKEENTGGRSVLRAHFIKL